MSETELRNVLGQIAGRLDSAEARRAEDRLVDVAQLAEMRAEVRAFVARQETICAHAREIRDKTQAALEHVPTGLLWRVKELEDRVGLLWLAAGLIGGGVVTLSIEAVYRRFGPK